MRSILPHHRALPVLQLESPLPRWVANGLWEARNKTSPSLEALWVLYLVTQGLLCCGWGWYGAGAGHGAGAMRALEGARSSGGHRGILSLPAVPASLAHGAPSCALMLVHGWWRTGLCCRSCFSGRPFPLPEPWARLEQRLGKEGSRCAPASVSPAPLHPGRCCHSREWGQPWLRACGDVCRGHEMAAVGCAC